LRLPADGIVAAHQAGSRVPDVALLARSAHVTQDNEGSFLAKDTFCVTIAVQAHECTPELTS
jgi:hypothetical protein